MMREVSPYSQVAEFASKQDTGEADSAPLISILYGGCQWCFYGTFAYESTYKSGFLVLVQTVSEQKKIPKAPKTPIIPKSKRSFPKSTIAAKIITKNLFTKIIFRGN